MREGLGIPVISVGNLSFGGTGKTPTVIALVRDLVRLGRRPAVLTRGYRRRGREQVVLVGPQPPEDVTEVGDEPLEMARRLPGVPVVVDADRVRGGREARRLGADVVVLDDGFQHRRLERDLDVVLLDAADPWGGGQLPPLGRLREPLSGFRRASAALVTKLPVDWRPAMEEIETRLAKIAPDIPVFAARMRLERVRLPNEGWQEPESLDGRRVLAFAGIGRPQGFLDKLVEAGANVVSTRWFPDHYRYSATDIESILTEAEAAGAVPVTTGKDAVKLPTDAAVWVVEAVMEPVDGSWQGLWQVEPEVVS
jgi:tetraacyldisaccharide 4'-kinase